MIDWVIGIRDNILMDKEIDKIYISLQQASEYCSYSQEYLSLRARQKKLKAKKIGRNWVTTKEWLDEYILSALDYKQEQEEKLEKKSLIEERIIFTEKRIKEIFPPANLPVGNFNELYPALFLKRENTDIFLRRVLVFSLAALLLVMANNFIQINSSKLWNQRKNLSNGVYNYSHQIADSGDAIFKEALSSFESINFVINNGTLSDVLKETGQTFKEYADWFGGKLGNGFKFVYRESAKGLGIRPRILEGLAQAEKKPIEPEKEGFVVATEKNMDKDSQQKIKENFSDEVNVKIIDDTSGVITPIFKKGQGEKYIYMLVPVKK